MPTDIALIACANKVAKKYGIKTIINGGNFSGKGILPLTWGYHVYKDEKLYRHIVKHYSKTRIKKVPVIGLYGEIWNKFFRGIKTIYPLNVIDYDKEQAREQLKNQFGWEDYGGKHHESRITAFWQSYVMPTKFDMDYRKATYSSQIVSGDMTREEALGLLDKKPYDDERIASDKQYIAKKFGISIDELESYLKIPPKTFKDFPNDQKKIEWFYNLYRKIRG